MPNKFTINDFVSIANKEHHDKYDYSPSIYLGSQHQIEIICPVHGSFWQRAISHIRGSGCPKCNTRNVPLDFNIFETRANEIHDYKYDYSLAKLDYKNATTKVRIICPIHGIFNQTPHSHTIGLGSGCPKCSKLDTAKKMAYSFEEFKQMAVGVHGNLYDYVNVNYINMLAKVEIICPIHGSFYQTPSDHIHQKCGCGKCNRNFIENIDEIISKAIKIHNGKWEYPEGQSYTGIYSNIKAICPIHGEFEQLITNHIHKKNGCPKCSHQISKFQLEIFEYLSQYDSNIILEDRINYPPHQLDITVPNKKLVIECNGVYWHSLNQGQRPLSHLNDKRLQLESLGLRVINIYEDEWINSRPQIEQIIKNALGVISTKIFARKCSIWKCSYTDINFQSHIIPFFNNYHHQGLNSYNKSIAYCLVYNNQIVASALFGFSKRCPENNDEIELLRYATIIDTKISGGLSKLISAFHKDYPQFKSIVSFCDNRFFTGKSYKKLGFECIHKGNVRFNVIIKFNGKLIRKHRLFIKKEAFMKFYDEKTIQENSQINLAMSLGWLIIPDCGHSKLILKI